MQVFMQVLRGRTWYWYLEAHTWFQNLNNRVFNNPPLADICDLNTLAVSHRIHKQHVQPTT